jgi:uncharacterized membrane protein
LSVEEAFFSVASALKLVAEISSVALIGAGLAVALYFVVTAFVPRRKKRYNKVRLSLGRFLVVGLEFQLAADIIGTAIAPTWGQIGQLAAIALIRTFLNYYLNKEIEITEKEEMNASAQL